MQWFYIFTLIEGCITKKLTYNDVSQNNSFQCHIIMFSTKMARMLLLAQCSPNYDLVGGGGYCN